MKQLKVEVFKTDIVRGKKGNATYCPVARAARRALKQAGIKYSTVCVAEGGIYVYYSSADHAHLPKLAFKLPKRASEFVNAFDNEKSKSQLKPFNFTAKYWGGQA